MNLPDTFYISLCMTILFIGAVYWVWTQIQYVQRKVNALENIVYELKQVCQQPKAPPAPPMMSMPLPSPLPTMEPDGMTTPALYAPPPVEEEEDILHETLRAEIERASVAAAANSDHVFEEPAAMPTSEVQTVTFEPEKGEFVFHGTTEEEGIPQYEEQPTDLQPGGVGSGEIQQTFALESMTTKELRRLANQRGISGVSDMKKKEIIAAIRALPSIDIFAEGVATE